MSLSIPLQISSVTSSRATPIGAIYRGIPVTLERATLSGAATINEKHQATYLYRGIEFTPAIAATRDARTVHVGASMLYRGHRIG
ncbi:MAG TPA: hypothetical protein VIV60_32255 [Polyangiaceae bacterium]